MVLEAKSHVWTLAETAKINLLLSAYFNMEAPLKWNKIILAAKIILFHLRRGFMLKQNKIL